MSQKLIINGYKVPGPSQSFIAVSTACEAVIKNPGISQKDLLAVAVKFSDLNRSTAGWITSPGSNSPAGKLWDRRKARPAEGGREVFCCYPNEWTAQMPSSDEALRAKLKSRLTYDFKEFKKRMGERILSPGDLMDVRYITSLGEEQPHMGKWIGVFVGWHLGKDLNGIGPRANYEDFFNLPPGSEIPVWETLHMAFTASVEGRETLIHQPFIYTFKIIS